MKVIIQSHHLEVTPSLKTHLEEKLHLIKKHFEQIIQVHVILSVEKAHEKDLRQIAELNIHVKGKDLFAIAHHDDLYQAIDSAVAKLDKQILKVKEITKNHHRPVAAKHISAIQAGLNL
jgi:putative sigma-54 modulation protein